jgi:hypothetical protein
LQSALEILIEAQEHETLATIQQILLCN